MSSAISRLYRVGIAGASSLRGKELKNLMEERGFPAEEIRLLDDEVAGGTLTEAGGEATFIQTVAADSFEKLDFVFFSGTPGFTSHYWQAARRAAGRVIDLSGALAGEADAVPWIPSLDASLEPPSNPAGSAVYASPPSAAIIACTLAAGLRAFQPRSMVMVCLRPVSERGQAGVDELESQTVSLLSFQPITRAVYDAQVAFNLLNRYGRDSGEQLVEARQGIVSAVARYLGGRVPLPALQLIQAPVFYSYAFAAYAELAVPARSHELESALCAAGARIAEPAAASPDNVSVAGESQIHLSPVEMDPGSPGRLWLWGAADNIRLAASNALGILERLIAS